MGSSILVCLCDTCTVFVRDAVLWCDLIHFRFNIFLVEKLRTVPGRTAFLHRSRAELCASNVAKTHMLTATVSHIHIVILTHHNLISTVMILATTWPLRYHYTTQSTRLNTEIYTTYTRVLTDTLLVCAFGQVFADVDGNIGYQMPGKVPRRVEGHTGRWVSWLDQLDMSCENGSAFYLMNRWINYACF